MRKFIIKLNMRNEWLKALIVAATVVSWSVVIILLFQIKSIVSQQPKVETVPVIEITDTIINEQPKFFSQTPKEGLEEALSYYGLEHKDIVYAQAVLETGHFKSKVCLKYNNLFGLYNSKEKRYCKFKHWTESVVAYKEWIQKKYQPPDNYYAFLEEINYASDKEYISTLKSIVNKKMTREEVNRLALSKIKETKYLILELITGMGKTRVAINLINYICDKVFRNDECPTSILILVAKTVHKQTWKDEIEKWGGIKSDYITIECYESLKKYEGAYFDVVVADEMQHLSEARIDVLETIHINESFIGLSATIKKDMRDYFIYNHKAEVIKCGLKEAVEDEVLPEPTVYLLPLALDNTRFNYKIKKFGRTITTTQRGYYNDISSLIEWYKNKFFNTRSERVKNLWLSTAGKRLKWCAEQKEVLVLSLLDKFKNYKTLTFCSSIEQAERLGKYNITSKNKASEENLEMFNLNKIKHITACSILNEGVNLTNCRIGIFCNLNSSEIITRQRCGRLLRHKSPIIIIPYFKDTREEELVQKMIEEYSEKSKIIINNMNDIKI